MIYVTPQYFIDSFTFDVNDDDLTVIVKFNNVDMGILSRNSGRTYYSFKPKNKMFEDIGLEIDYKNSKTTCINKLYKINKYCEPFQNSLK